MVVFGFSKKETNKELFFDLFFLYKFLVLNFDNTNTMAFSNKNIFQQNGSISVTFGDLFCFYFLFLKNVKS